MGGGGWHSGEGGEEKVGSGFGMTGGRDGGGSGAGGGVLSERWGNGEGCGRGPQECGDQLGGLRVDRPRGGKGVVATKGVRTEYLLTSISRQAAPEQSAATEKESL